MENDPDLNVLSLQSAPIIFKDCNSECCRGLQWCAGEANATEAVGKRLQPREHHTRQTKGSSSAFGLKLLRFPVQGPPSVECLSLLLSLLSSSPFLFFRIVTERLKMTNRGCAKISCLVLCVMGGAGPLGWMQLSPRPSKEEARMMCLSDPKGSPLAASSTYCSNSWDRPKDCKTMPLLLGCATETSQQLLSSTWH